MSAPDSTEQPLLVVIDPVARRVDGESVRIARDVLCGGAVAKICLPDGPEDVERALARRGRRRPVVIGDDRALLHAVGLLQQRRELPEVPVALVPVGALPEVSLARTLGVPLGSVAAARAVLDGAERRLDALVDEGGTVVLGGLWIPGSGGLNPADETTETPEGNGPNGSYEPLGTGEAAAPAAAVAGDPAGAPGGPGVAAVTGLAGASDVTGVTVDHQPWWSPAARTARSALALLTGPAARHPLPVCTRLRVEADGVVLTDLDQPVARVSVTAVDGFAEVVVHPHGAEAPLRARAYRVTVSGPDFRYRADNVLTGPVRTRTWTVREGAWRLILPREPGGSAGG
ncbi:hypothetical protein ABZ951_32615 [Streptomyces sp. NPDC046215]|uniref:Diacylglycerol kinase family protein n=1 Tax=Streptomyces stramineus TaxID=173861 RepID=A0ABN1AHQ5_9ACTN